jgi:hypothetical protein
MQVLLFLFPAVNDFNKMLFGFGVDERGIGSLKATKIEYILMRFELN